MPPPLELRLVSSWVFVAVLTSLAEGNNTVWSGDLTAGSDVLLWSCNTRRIAHRVMAGMNSLWIDPLSSTYGAAYRTEPDRNRRRALGQWYFS